jgi:hypothetical protein
MATYKITEIATGNITWTEDETQACIWKTKP